MANYSLIINSKYKPFSYQELLAPALMATQAHQDIETQYADLDTKASVWENMANEQTDPYAYKMYKKYSDDLRNAAEQLAQSGLSPSSRQNMLKLRARYSQEITPIEQAYTARQKQAEQQQQALLQDPTLMLSRRASTTSLDDYIRNPQLGYESYSGKLLTAQAAQAAQTLAKQMRQDPRKWRDILGGAYYETMMQKGFSSQDVLNAIQRNPNAKQELLNIIDQVVGSSKIATWNDKEALQRAYEYAGQGLWSGIGETQYQMVQNPDHLNPLQRAQLAQIRQQQQATERALKMNDLGLTDFYSKSDIAKKNQGYIDLYKDFRKKGYITEAGQLTRAGLKEYNRITGKITALDLQGTGKMSSKGIERSTRTPLYNFLKDLGYKSTGNGRQDLLHINSLLKQARHNIITGNTPIGDIQFSVVRMPVSETQSKDLAGRISAELGIQHLNSVGRMTQQGNTWELKENTNDFLTKEDLAALLKNEYKDEDGHYTRIMYTLREPNTHKHMIQLTNGKKYIIPSTIYSKLARIGMLTGDLAASVPDATTQQKALALEQSNSYQSSIFNQVEGEKTKYIDSNATIVYP